MDQIRRSTTISQADADLLVSEASIQPRSVERRAEDLLRDVVALDAGTAATLWHAVGSARRADRRPGEARPALETALVFADRASDSRRRGLVLVTLAFTLELLGDSEEASRSIDGAVELLDGADLANAYFERGVMHQVRGRVREALDDFALVRPFFTEDSPIEWQGDLANNEAVCLIYLGELDHASEALHRAESLYTSMDHRIGVGMAVHNRGWLLELRGDPIDALVHFERAADIWTATDFPAGTLAVDRCGALVGAGLFREAAAVAQETSNVLAESEMWVQVGQAQVVVAETLLLAGNPTGALSACDVAEQHLRSGGQDIWQLRNRYVRSRGMLALDLEPADDALAFSEDLRAAGLRANAAEFRIAVARFLIRSAELDGVDELLDIRSDLVIEVEVHRQLGIAELCFARRKDRDAIAALTQAIKSLRNRQYQANTSEVRIHSARALDDIAALGIACARRLGDASELRRWCGESRRLVRPTSGPVSEAAAAAINDLRAISYQLLCEIGPHEDERREGLLSRERRARQTLRAERESAVALEQDEILPGRGPTDVLIIDDGELVAVRTEPVPCIEVAARADDLLDPTARLAAMFPIAMTVELGLASEFEMESAIQSLAELVPQRDDVVVQVALGVHQVPWSAVRMCPTIELVSRGVVSPRPARSIDRLTGREVASKTGNRTSTSGLVLSGLESDLLIIHAHFVVSEDSPFFDGILLEDGVFYAHELDAVESVPDTVVLAACASARTTQLGGRRIGFAQALLDAGVKRVIGFAYPVPDTPDLLRVLEILEEHLLSGILPEEAVSRTAWDERLEGPAKWIARTLVTLA